MKNFKTFMSEYADYKASRGKGNRVSLNEARALHREWSKLNESMGAGRNYANASVRNRVRESRPNGKPLNDISVVIKNYKKVKAARLGESKVTYTEVKKLREAVAQANRRGIRMAEADENYAADAAQGQPQMGATPDQGAASVSPDVQSQIQSLLSQVQSLAAGVGIQVNDLGPNASAGIPAVEGQQPAQDPNAGQPQQPMMESVYQFRSKNGACDEASFIKIKEATGKAFVEKIGTTKDRIAMRSAKLECMNESYEGDFASAYFKAVGLREASNPIEGIPSEKELAKGTADAKGQLAKELRTPVAWPDHQINSAALQGEGAKQQKVKENGPSVDDKYVENYFSDKLSFDKIRESMKTGLLG